MLYELYNELHEYVVCGLTHLPAYQELLDRIDELEFEFEFETEEEG